MGTYHPSHLSYIRNDKIFFDQWRCIYCNVTDHDKLILKQCGGVNPTIILPVRSKFALERQHKSHLFGPKGFDGNYFHVYSCVFCKVTDSSSDAHLPCPYLC